TNAKTSSLTGLKQRRIIGKVAFYVLGLLVAIIVCIPFYWMIITSLKGRGAIMSIPVEWIPKEPTLDAYKKLFAMPEFVGSIFNSFYVSVLCTAVRLLCAAMAAFALTKIPFKGRNAVFGIYVTALMIPSQITFIPLFIIMTNMHLTNSSGSRSTRTTFCEKRNLRCTLCETTMSGFMCAAPTAIRAVPVTGCMTLSTKRPDTVFLCAAHLLTIAAETP
ncbi:carbohydrate ABC transporter permease, partial [Butyricicoccus sp.]|uniref:carbohydrate ABC transporter permease n=1 Tax=Butyricicoccus sp. TaxID=2049021 RepID=UPI003AAE109F